VILRVVCSEGLLPAHTRHVCVCFVIISVINTLFTCREDLEIGVWRMCTSLVPSSDGDTAAACMFTRDERSGNCAVVVIAENSVFQENSTHRFIDFDCEDEHSCIGSTH
jgi:hypothetical protein